MAITGLKTIIALSFVPPPPQSPPPPIPYDKIHLITTPYPGPSNRLPPRNPLKRPLQQLLPLTSSSKLHHNTTSQRNLCARRRLLQFLLLRWVGWRQRRRGRPGKVLDGLFGGYGDWFVIFIPLFFLEMG